MCIISQVADVSATKIFVALNASQSRQLTVYQNKVATVPGSVMILPVPDPTTVKMIDLSNYANIFTDLNGPFQMLSAGFSYNGSREILQVTKVGGYLVTIVPSVQMFPNLSAETFGVVDTDIVRLLADRYPSCGFIVCKLNPEKTEYHPIAYSHKSDQENFLYRRTIYTIMATVNSN